MKVRAIEEAARGGRPWWITECYDLLKKNKYNDEDGLLNK